MRLDVYMKLHKISQGDMAERLGITRVHTNMIANGNSVPSRRIAKKIEELTNGSVSRLELLYPFEVFNNCDVS